MPEPAIGRTGVVLTGLGHGLHDPDRPRGRQIRCNHCRQLFTADHHDCPGCGGARPGFNKSIRAAQLNGALHAQAAEQKKPHRLRHGYDRIYKAARKQVDLHGPRAFLRP